MNYTNKMLVIENLLFICVIIFCVLIIKKAIESYFYLKMVDNIANDICREYKVIGKTRTNNENEWLIICTTSKNPPDDMEIKKIIIK